MNKEGFRILKEINSLDSSKKELESTIQDELARVSKLHDMKDNRIQEEQTTTLELKELKVQFQKIEGSISEFQSKLNKAKSDLTQLFDQKEIDALSNQIQKIEENIDNLETNGFNLMEDIELKEESLNEAKGFLSGIDTTINEMQSEIEEENQELFNKIKSINSRLENLYTQIPNEIHEKYQKLLSLNMKHGPLTKISGRECYICKYMLATHDISLVEDKMMIKSCGQCKRIFIPSAV